MHKLLIFICFSVLIEFGSLSKRFEVGGFKGPAFKGEPNELDNGALSFLPA